MRPCPNVCTEVQMYWRRCRNAQRFAVCRKRKMRRKFLGYKASAVTFKDRQLTPLVTRNRACAVLGQCDLLHSETARHQREKLSRFILVAQAGRT